MAEFLVIDDSMIMRKNIKSILESLGHKVVGELKDGVDIVNKYKEYQPDVISLDLVMPQVDGLEALKKLKNEHPEAKVMVVTCLGTKKKILRALNLGADYFIEKPFEIKDITVALNTLLDAEDIFETEIEGIEIVDDCNCSHQQNMLLEESDSELRKKEVEERLKKELQEFEIVEERATEDLEEKLDEIASDLDEMNNVKPLQVVNEAGILKIKVNKKIDEKMIELMNNMIEKFLIIDSLKISFDLKDVDFALPDLKTEFEKIINKIKVVGGEVEIISSES